MLERRKKMESDSCKNKETKKTKTTKKQSDQHDEKFPTKLNKNKILSPIVEFFKLLLGGKDFFYYQIMFFHPFQNLQSFG